jgi:hypothetical protein
VQNMIRCTGVNTNLKNIPFSSELERNLGFALGTADLLGQMAAPDYVEKLDILYEEFEESAKYHSKPGMFTSVEDMRSKTPGFWKFYVVPKITNDFLGLHRYLGHPPTDRNDYILRIETNLRKLEPQPA